MHFYKQSCGIRIAEENLIALHLKSDHFSHQKFILIPCCFSVGHSLRASPKSRAGSIADRAPITLQIEERLIFATPKAKIVTYAKSGIDLFDNGAFSAVTSRSKQTFCSPRWPRLSRKGVVEREMLQHFQMKRFLAFAKDLFP